MILQLSEAGMPNFHTIWKNPITYEARQLFFAQLISESPVAYSISKFSKCAASILGEGKPEKMYGLLSHQEWLSDVNKQLEKSNLQDAIERLVNDMVISSPIRALKTHGQRLRKLLKTVIHTRRYVEVSCVISIQLYRIMIDLRLPQCRAARMLDPQIQM
jgi:hypothetical protein